MIKTLLALGRGKEASDRAIEAVRSFKASSESIELLREVYRRNGNEPGIVPALWKIYQERPKDHAILFALADTLDSLGKPADAVALLNDAYDKSAGQNFDIAHWLVALFLKHDEPDRAARLLIRVSAEKPDLINSISDLWDDVLHVTGPNRFRLADLQRIEVPAELEPARLFWVSRVALLNGRNDLLEHHARTIDSRHAAVSAGVSGAAEQLLVARLVGRGQEDRGVKRAGGFGRKANARARRRAARHGAVESE